MTPAELDRDVVHAKLRTMRDLLDDLAGVGEVTAAVLEQDRILRHAVERVITQLVELAASINGHVGAALVNRGPADYRESFALAAEAGIISKDLAAQLASSAGLRNLLVHEYASIDLARVAASVAEALAGYQQYVAEVAGALLQD